MVLKVRLLGNGTSNDPYRVALPTYNLLHGNVSQRFAYISVPDDTIFPANTDLSGEQRDETTEGDFYPQFSADLLTSSADHLDLTYKEHKGEYRIDHV